MRHRLDLRRQDLRRTEPPTPLEIVRAAARDYERAKRTRDASIAEAKASGKTSLRELAQAADLSVSRVKQIALSPVFGEASLPPVPEMDLYIERGRRDADEHDRIFALDTVDPWLHRWPSERDFLLADPPRPGDPPRLDGSRSDFAYDVYDLDPTQRWVVVYLHGTREVYAFAARTAFPSGDTTVGPDADPTKGSLAGPCVLLGHAFSYDFLDAGLGFGIHNIRRRPGGLAWVYGRLRLLNRLLATASMATTGITAEPTVVWDYLQALPDYERTL